jgi:predicted DNA-binding protein (UPF0251 family)
MHEVIAVLIEQGRGDLAVAASEALALQRFRLRDLQDLVQKHKGKDMGVWKSRIHRFRFQSAERLASFSAALKKLLGPYAGHVQQMGSNTVTIPEWMVFTAVRGKTVRAKIIR